MIRRARCSVIFAIAFFYIFKIVCSQDPKPPEAVDDDGSGLQGGLVTISVLQNDFAEDSHPIKVVSAVGTQHADVVFTDSTVTYIPHVSGIMVYPDIDSVRYRIKDLVNGLMSGFGTITITLTTLDFNFSRDTLILNNYSAPFNASGSYFYDYYGETGLCFEIPLGSGLHTIKRSNLLIGGRRDNYVEHVAGEHDHIIGSFPLRHGSDFWPGPVSSVFAYTNDYDSLWNKTWKLNREMIHWHQEHWADPGYQVPDVINSWPGNGDPDMGQASGLAPFQDSNENGLYEPLFGEYPAVPGDQVIYSLYNDQRTVGIATHSDPLGIEVHQMAYAFDCPEDSVFKNSLFIRYLIINRSENDFTNLFCGIFSAFNIGGGGDEYMGCDTLLDCYYGYNDSLDELFLTFTGSGDDPPAQGICFLNHGLHGFIGPQEPGWNGSGFYYNLLRGLWAPGGEPMTYGGNGHGGTETTTFLFPGDPGDPQQWSDYQVNPGNPGIRNGIGATGPFGFFPGDTIRLDIAYVFARDYGGTNLSSVALLKERIAQLRWFYENDTLPCGKVWSETPTRIPETAAIHIFPVPAGDYITIDWDNGKNARIDILDGTGRTRIRQMVQPGTILDISPLEPGIYIVSITLESATVYKKLIVQ